MLLLEHIHLLGLLVGAVDGLADGHADGAAGVLTTVVVGEHVAGGDAVGDLTLLVLALGNMLPEPLHAGAVRRDGALPVLVGALRGVAKEEEALLLVPEHLLPVGVVGGSSGRVPVAVGGGLLTRLEVPGGHGVVSVEGGGGDVGQPISVGVWVGRHCGVDL